MFDLSQTSIKGLVEVPVDLRIGLVLGCFCFVFAVTGGTIKVTSTDTVREGGEGEGRGLPKVRAGLRIVPVHHPGGEDLVYLKVPMRDVIVKLL